MKLKGSSFDHSTKNLKSEFWRYSQNKDLKLLEPGPQMKWVILGSILSDFGAKYENNTLELFWSVESFTDLKLLGDLFRKIVKGLIIANFDNNKGIWRISI